MSQGPKKDGMPLALALTLVPTHWEEVNRTWAARIIRSSGMVVTRRQRWVASLWAQVGLPWSSLLHLLSLSQHLPEHRGEADAWAAAPWCQRWSEERERVGYWEFCVQRPRSSTLVAA